MRPDAGIDSHAPTLEIFQRTPRWGDVTLADDFTPALNWRDSVTPPGLAGGDLSQSAGRGALGGLAWLGSGAKRGSLPVSPPPQPMAVGFKGEVWILPRVSSPATARRGGRLSSQSAQEGPRTMAGLSCAPLALLLLLLVLLPVPRGGAQRPAGLRRQRTRWQDRGRLDSLPGSQLPAAGGDPPRRDVRGEPSGDDARRNPPPGTPASPRDARGHVPDVSPEGIPSGARGRGSPTGARARGSRRGSGARGGDAQPGTPSSRAAPAPGEEEWGAWDPESMAGDDPRNPYKSWNTVLYNVYSGGGPRQDPAAGHRRPGYGTRYFQNGERALRGAPGARRCVSRGG